MAELDIFEEAPKKWIPFDSDTEVLIKYLGKEVMTRISEKSAEVSRKIKGSYSVISNKLTGRAAVHGWRKKIDHDHPGLMIAGKPIPFTPDSIDFLMSKSIDFSNFVNTKCIDSTQFRDEVEVNIDAIAIDLFGDTESIPEESTKNAS